MVCETMNATKRRMSNVRRAALSGPTTPPTRRAATRRFPARMTADTRAVARTSTAAWPASIAMRGILDNMTAIITGASSGIGLELARVFAEHRHDVVLVARSETKLQTLAAELQARGVRAHVIVVDLSAPGAAKAIVDRVRNLAIEVDVLVNNAGYGVYGAFLDTSLDAELAMIQVNIVALTELTKRVLPAMVARKSGRILNVASTAAFLPGPLMAVYYATKAYVLSFSEAIANEVCD